jgi:hypothetical protein
MKENLVCIVVSQDFNFSLFDHLNKYMFCEVLWVMCSDYFSAASGSLV